MPRQQASLRQTEPKSLTLRMDNTEESDHAFIIRIWKENREAQGASPVWRGVIEHVPSGRNRYLQDLVQIITFLNPYIEEMGIEKSLFWQWVVRIRGLKYRFKRPQNPSNPTQEISTNE